MSTQIIAVIVLIASQLLPFIGVETDSAKLNDAIQTIVALVSGVWIWIQRTRLTKIKPGEESDITPLGARK